VTAHASTGFPFFPMTKIKNILHVVAAVCVLVWLLYAFGILGRGGDVPGSAASLSGEKGH